ncbi:MAG: RagB/SusD family nutrient uptake outer membrane protein [Tannerella sp.]|jgi:hypothetical protein|nr:RagB/SusD family nutrient uptake outer membrane protein [Tannerella sp.]
MKLYKFTWIALILSLNACDDFLDRQPHDQISQAVFYESKSHFEMALGGNYRLLQQPVSAGDHTRFFTESQPGWDCLSDNCYGKHGWGQTKEILAGNLTPSTGGYIEHLYSGCYNGIARVNIFLSELTAYHGEDMTQAEKNVFEGEARLIRAYYYFHLYMFYGDVPLVLEPLTVETQAQPKVSAAEIMTQILADIDFAITNLKNISYTENAGHVTRSTAQALKARALSFTAYDRSGTPDPAVIRQVRDLCLEIMPLYSLSADYADLFKSNGQINNPEIIWSINYLAPNNNCVYQTFQVTYVAWNPHHNLVEDYECIDGLPWGESPLTNPANIFENRDPRLKRTIYQDIIVWDDGTTHIPTEERITGYGVMKYIDQKNVASDMNPVPAQADVDAVVIRLAEVLLMYAEMQNELEGPDASVYHATTDLRARAGLPPYPAGLSKEQMRERIRHERRVELAFEQGLRLYDIKRWHIVADVLSRINDGIINYRFEERFYKWPLPETEIEKSGGILIQNPDYQ